MTGDTKTSIIINQKIKDESIKKVNSWFTSANPIVQSLEYFYNQRKKNG